MQDFELEELSKIKNPQVAKLLDEYLDFRRNPAKKFHLKVLQLIDMICEDIDMIAEAQNEPLPPPEEKDDEDNSTPDETPSNLKLLGKKNPLFDQAMALIKNTPAVQEAIRVGQVASEIINPEKEAAKEKKPRKMVDGIPTP